MYKVWVPLFNRKWTDEHKSKLLSELLRLQPDVVLLTYARIICDEEKKKAEFETYSENKRFLEENGYTVGAWLAPTIGYGAPYYYDNGAPFTRIHGLTGEDDIFVGSFCPLDEGFVSEFFSVLKNILDTDTKIIMFEDDYTLSGGKAFFPRLGCCCPKHMELLQQKLGEKITREQMCRYVVDCGENRYRQAWLDVMGDTLRSFTQKIEHFVHSIDKEVRIGLSANGSSFSAEGVSIAELARIVAGKNRPFLRITGAPYWRNLPTYATNIEAERLQCHWCGEGIELIAEGDTFPRPRHFVPASYLEIFDTVLRADGGTHGILKYVIDYNSSPTYETGYVDRHLRNGELYREIEKRFSFGKTEGLRIFENTALMEKITFGKDHPKDVFGIHMPLVSQNFTADNSIPVTYGESLGASLVFGENAKYITPEMLDRGVILDAPAAKILTDRGIDIGIEDITPVSMPVAEYFKTYNELTACSFEGEASFYRFSLKKNAREISRFYISGQGLGTIPSEGIENCDGFPACVLYENGQGQRFMIYSFAPETVIVRNGWNCGVFRNYCRQKQLADGIEWLQKKPLPALCLGNPFLYILCKRNGKKLSVGLWNIFPDEAIEPEIFLDKEYKTADFYGCDGVLEGRKIKINGTVQPYGIALFTVEE